jgi:hypothetical protein
MNRIFYTVYQITNKVNGKIYVGVHKTTNPNDGYLGSGKALNCAILKYGKENFIKEVIFNAFTYEDAHAIESQIVNAEFIKSENTYNMKVGGKGGSLPKTEAQKKHLSELNMGKPSPRKGVKLSEETKALIGSYHKGKFVDPEISKALWKDETFRAKRTKENHPAAKIYKLIDPNGIEHIVIGSLKIFATDNDLSYNSLKRNEGLGPIQAPKVAHRKTQSSINTYGWTVQLQCPETSPA